MRPIQFLTAQAIFDRAVDHLLGQRRAGLLPRGGAAYRSGCGGCPIGSFIRPSDYTSTIEGVPVRFLTADPLSRPAYMDAGIAALRRALIRAKINVFDERTVALLSCLQNVHDVFAVAEWEARLVSIAGQFNLSCERLRLAA